VEMKTPSLLLFAALLCVCNIARAQPSGIEMHVKNSGTIRAGEQQLDGIMFENVTFEGTRILYSGGPTVLKNVSFKNCILIIRHRPPNANEQQLDEALTGSKTRVIQEFSKSILFVSVP